MQYCNVYTSDHNIDMLLTLSYTLTPYDMAVNIILINITDSEGVDAIE